MGELLIDFTEAGISHSGMRLFEQNPGGAPANVLAALSRLGKNTAFIGKVGADMHGEFLRGVLQENNIDTTALLQDPTVFTTLAFVGLGPDGERNFSFARKPGADTCLKPEELCSETFSHLKVFHFGSLSLTQEPARSATLRAIHMAKEAGAWISYDPNYRAALWPDREAAVRAMRSVLPWVNLVKLSDEETELLTGCAEPRQALEKLLAQGVAIACVTLGAGGALVAPAHGMRHVAGYPTRVTDTTGAGDCFWGGFLNTLLEKGLGPRAPRDFTLDEVADAADFGNAAASLCVEKRGAIPAMPRRDEVELRRAGNSGKETL